MTKAVLGDVDEQVERLTTRTGEYDVEVECCRTMTMSMVKNVPSSISPA